MLDQLQNCLLVTLNRHVNLIAEIGLTHDFDISYANYKPGNTDSVITVDLVMNNISKLKKCGKAAGIDSVTAEHLKYAHHRITILLCIF